MTFHLLRRKVGLFVTRSAVCIPNLFVRWALKQARALGLCYEQGLCSPVRRIGFCGSCTLGCLCLPP